MRSLTNVAIKVYFRDENHILLTPDPYFLAMFIKLIVVFYSA
jgi:hypothetical protein